MSHAPSTESIEREGVQGDFDVLASSVHKLLTEVEGLTPGLEYTGDRESCLNEIGGA